MRVVSLDFETTGSVPGWRNEPWQLGLVEIVNGIPDPSTRREYFFRMPHDRPFSPSTPGRWAKMRDELASAPTFMDVWGEIAEILVGSTLIAHNAATERTILTRLAPLTPLGPWEDTYLIAKKSYKLPSYKLGDLITSFNLQPHLDAIFAGEEGRTWHDALYDACAGAYLFCSMKAIRQTEFLF